MRFFSHSLYLHVVSLAGNQRHILPFNAAVDDVHLMAGNIFNSHWCWKLFQAQVNIVVVVVYCLPHMPIPFRFRRHCLVFGSSFYLSLTSSQFSAMCFAEAEWRNRSQSRRVVCDVIMMWRMLENDAWFCFYAKTIPKMSMYRKPTMMRVPTNQPTRKWIVVECRGCGVRAFDIGFSVVVNKNRLQMCVCALVESGFLV